MRRHRRGSTLIYCAVTGSVLCGILALSVDMSRGRAARAELQNAIDAAARYGAVGLSDSTTLAKATAVAAQNTVDGNALALTAADVSVGYYDAATRTFTVNGTPTNGVRVKIAKNSGRNVPTALARVLGVTNLALSAESFALDKNFGATAAATPTGPIAGFVGLNWFNINGAMTVQAWDSSTNTVLPTTTAWAAAQTKGPSNLNSGVNIQGELQTSGSVSMNSATITKGIKTLPTGWGTYAAPVAPAGATYLGNYNGPAGASQTFGAGVYRFDSFNVPSGKTVVFSGAAQVYVNGSINIAGNITTSGNLPSNLKLYNTSGSGVDIGTSTSPLYADIYAPNSPFNLNSRTFYGSLIATGINVNSAFNMYIDARTSTGGFAASGGSATPSITLVKPTTVN